MFYDAETRQASDFPDRQLRFGCADPSLTFIVAADGSNYSSNGSNSTFGSRGSLALPKCSIDTNLDCNFLSRLGRPREETAQSRGFASHNPTDLSLTLFDQIPFDHAAPQSGMGNPHSGFTLCRRTRQKLRTIRPNKGFKLSSPPGGADCFNTFQPAFSSCTTTTLRSRR